MGGSFEITRATIPQIWTFLNSTLGASGGRDDARIGRPTVLILTRTKDSYLEEAYYSRNST
jgi:hypothetical protein